MAKRQKVKFFELIPNEKTSFGSALSIVTSKTVMPDDADELSSTVYSWYEEGVLTFREFMIIERRLNRIRDEYYMRDMI